MNVFFAVTVALWALRLPAALAQGEEVGAEPRSGSATADAAPATTAESATGPTRSGDPEADVPPAEAGERSRRRTIEEIVVTAQRTEEQLHDVPISMSAFDDRFLDQQGITDLQDVTLYVPNVNVLLAGTYIQPRIRGFSTNVVVNRGLELPVGIVIDEVPYSRGDYFLSGLFDLERVEVLRGPQGQLFGANTTVGLLNLTTKNPTDEFTGFVDAELGELDARRFEGGIGGPLVPGLLNFRIAAVSDERDGFVENTTARIVPAADDVFGSRERRSVRAKLEAPDLLGGSLLVSYQRDHLDMGATQRELTHVPQKFRNLLLQYDPNTDMVPGNLTGSLDTPGFREADIDTVAAKASYDLGGWGLDLVAGWSGLESLSRDDADSAPWFATEAIVDEVSRQTTSEFRVTSPDLAGFFGIGSLFGLPLGSTDFTSGLFFQRRTQSPTNSHTNIDVGLLLLSQVLNPLPDQPLLIPRPPAKVEFFENRFEQAANEFAGYGQMNWRLAERWTLLYGMRLSYATKNASWVQQTGPAGAIVIPAAIESFADELDYDDFQFSPKVGGKFDWSEDLNFYAHWSSNHQAGGFNNFTSSADPATRRVKPARVESWEAGSKTRLLDGTAEVNLGLFWMTMKDFQLFTLTTVPGATVPIPQAFVVNVGELRARGVEADGTWLPTDWLTLRGALGFNDTEYLEFPIGTCMMDRPNTDGDSDPRCDLAGRPLEQAPHWEISFTPSVRVPLVSIARLGSALPAWLADIELASALAVQYTDNRYLNDTDDPRTRQPSFFLLDANLGFANPHQGWSVQVRVENLTDERTHVTAYEGAPAGGLVFKAPSPPRLVYGGIRYEF